jgi:MATE family multidrug resistance protein
VRELLRLAWPIAVSMVSYAVMTTVDTLFVGHLGAYALAGVGLAGVTAFMLLTFCFGLLRGVKILASQARGAGRDGSVPPIVGAGLIYAAGMGALAIAAGHMIADLLPRFSGSEAAGAAASEYLAIRVLAAPMVLAFVALREGSYGLGDTRGPMRASIAANLANVGLDTLLIYGVGWGVRGAALASVAATAVELAVICKVAPRVELADLRRGAAYLKRVFEVGAPTGFQFLIEVGSFMAL